MNSSKLRIAIFSPSLVVGGAERVVVNLANGLSKRGFQTHLLLANPIGALLSEVEKTVEVISLGQKGVFASLFSLVRYLKANRPDILLSAQSHSNLIAIWASLVSKVPTKIVISEHSTFSITYALEPGLRNKIVPLLARLFFNKADAVICVSQGVAADLIQNVRLPSQRIHIIYNPVVTHGFLLQTRQHPTHPWFESANPPVILSVGRLTAAKDYPTLLQAFAQVREQRQALLLILGEGEKRRNLEHLINKLGLIGYVSMPGYDPKPGAAMSKAAVFVLSSLWEGFSNAIVEALACGTPVVATDCPSGPSEILEDGIYGRLVPVKDVSAMRDAILETLDAPSDRAILQRRAQEFTLDAALDKYLALFSTLVA